MHIHSCTFAHTYIYTQSCVHTYIYTHTQGHTNIHTLIYIHAHIHTCKHAHIHTYVYTSMHTYLQSPMLMYIYRGQKTGNQCGQWAKPTCFEKFCNTKFSWCHCSAKKFPSSLNYFPWATVSQLRGALYSWDRQPAQLYTPSKPCCGS